MFRIICAIRIYSLRLSRTTFRSPTQLRGKYDDLLRDFLSVRLLIRCNADIRRGRDMTQIGRYLFIGCERLFDNYMDHA
jgi:hypothetical protein